MRFNKIAFFIPVFLVVFAFGSVQSYANQYEFFTDRAAFLAEYPDLKIQNFSQSNVAPSTFEVCTSPANSNSNDDCFSPDDIMQGIQFEADIQGPGNLLLQGRNGIGINNPENSLIGNGTSPLNIIFNQGPYNIASLEIGCLGPALGICSQEVTVAVFGSQSMIGSTTVNATDAFQTFLGITADESIAFIRIFRENNPMQNSIGVSEVRFGMSPRNVPTISEWGMIATVAGLGLIGFMVIRRRRKAFN